MRESNYKVFKWERLFDFGSITALVTQFSPADNCGVQEVIIRDKNPVRRQGLTDYRIRRFWWYRKLVYAVEIEASWFRVPEYQEFPSLRVASDWLRTQLKIEPKPAKAVEAVKDGQRN